VPWGLQLLKSVEKAFLLDSGSVPLHSKSISENWPPRVIVTVPESFCIPARNPKRKTNLPPPGGDSRGGSKKFGLLPPLKRGFSIENETKMD